MPTRSDIPGLKRLPKSDGFFTWYWASSQITRRAMGFAPTVVRLWHGRGEPSPQERLAIRDRALRLTVDLKDWMLRQDRGRRQLKKRKVGSIYFIRAGDRVKIGFTQNVARRTSQLQTFFPDDLEVLLVTPGSPMLERELHRRFAALQIRREWFLYEGPVVEHVVREQDRSRSEPFLSESLGLSESAAPCA
jgi:hypothetical protein